MNGPKLNFGWGYNIAFDNSAVRTWDLESQQLAPILKLSTMQFMNDPKLKLGWGYNIAFDCSAVRTWVLESQQLAPL